MFRSVAKCRNLASMLMIVTTTSCMLGPFSGQRIEGRSSAVAFWGYHLSPGTSISIEALDPVGGDWERIGSTSCTSGSSFTSTDGYALYAWRHDTVIPEKYWEWDGRRCRAQVRAVANDAPLMSVEEEWFACYSQTSGLGDFANRCAAPSSPAAIVYTDDYPLWWDHFEGYLVDEITISNLSPVPMDKLLERGVCQDDAIADRLLQAHGQAILDGIAALPWDEEKAKERFADALRDLSRFAQTLYCVDIDGLRYWDRAIARVWRGFRGYPCGDFGFRQAVLATWNPALLVVDAIQFTGESEIIATFQEFETEIRRALADYPIDTYGAAWLDDFGTGYLAQVTGSKAHVNLTGVMADPIRLGLGLNQLLEHAASDDPYAISLAGLNSSLCGRYAREFIGDALLAAGIASLEHTGDAGGDAAQSGQEHTSSVTWRYPEYYFGTRTDDLLGQGSPVMDALCSAIPDKARGLSIPPVAANFHRACVFAGRGPGINRAPTAQIMACTRAHSATSQLLRHPISADLVDWNGFSNCGASQGKRDGTLTSEDGERHKKLKEKAEEDEKQGTPKSSPEKAREKANNTPVFNTAKEYERGLAAGRADGEIGTNERPDAFTLFSGDSAEIFINPDAATPALPATYGSILEHERDHVYLTERGVDNTDGYQDKIMRKNGDPNASGSGSQGQPTWESGGCRLTAAEQRSRLMFTCLFGDSVPEPLAQSLDPWINPLEVGGEEGLCNEVSTDYFVRGQQGGVTDPMGPEDTSTGGPWITIDFVPRIDGVIDPSPLEWDLPQSVFDPGGSLVR